MLSGRMLYDKNGCSACNSIHVKGGTLVPDLTRVGSKRDRDWFNRHFKDPQAMSTGSPCGYPDDTVAGLRLGSALRLLAGLDYNGDMLKTIRLKNFKLHEDTSIEAAPITVFIGPNNSGKSSIFQALLLLRQAALRDDQRLCLPSSGEMPGQEPYQYSPQRSVDVGKFEEIIRRREDEIQLEFSGTVLAGKPLHEVEQASVSAQLHIRENRLALHTGQIECSGARTSWEFVEGLPDKTGKIEGLNLKGTTFLVQPLQSFKLTSPGGFRDATAALPREVYILYNETSMWLGALPSNLLWLDTSHLCPSRF